MLASPHSLPNHCGCIDVLYFTAKLVRQVATMDADQEQLIDQFVNVTSASRDTAQQYLLRNKNDIMNAIEDFYASSGKSRSRPSSGINTLSSLRDKEDEDSTNNNFFTGGEKSGLQVEDPNKDKKKKGGSLIDQIFQRARDQLDQPDTRPSAQEDDEGEGGPTFEGTGFKLGDGTTPSQQIGSAAQPTRQKKVTREITFWRQGFTVGEGALHRYDDPNNEDVLQELNRGRVPIAILDVEFGQDVDVSVFRKTDEDWTPPKRKVGGFHGLGQRLGSPVPGESPATAEQTPEPVAPPKPSAAPVDEGEGDSTVQIRFANGKRVSHKFNSSDSINTVYQFVRNHPHSEARPFILSHSFPVKPIEESEETTVADAKLKNAVIVQRWK